MIIYPAIDIKNGKCVRLYQGDYQRETIYDNYPLNVVRNFIASGASDLHVVDLNGAANPLDRQEQILETLISSFDINIQVGGGIRTKDQITKLLDLGASRVIIGSLAVTNPKEVREWLIHFGSEKLGIALDIIYGKNMEPMITTNAWKNVSQFSLFDLLNYYQDSKLKHVICTNVALDGTLAGPDFNLYAEIANKFDKLNIQSSGGIQSLSDIQQLRNQGLHGAIIGRALYENKFSLSEVLTC